MNPLHSQVAVPWTAKRSFGISLLVGVNGGNGGQGEGEVRIVGQRLRIVSADREEVRCAIHPGDLDVEVACAKLGRCVSTTESGVGCQSPVTELQVSATTSLVGLLVLRTPWLVHRLLHFCSFVLNCSGV